MIPTEETWKPIPGFTGYEVSDHGQVRSYRKRYGFGEWYISDTPQRILRTGNDNGYSFVRIMNGDGDPIVIKVHRLVMLAFVGPYPEDMEVCHTDGNCMNNNLSNLRYDTHAANMQEASESGNMGKVVDKDTVVTMRQLRSDGQTIEEISERHSIPVGTVRAVVTGRTWKYSGGPLTKGSVRLSEDDVLTIRERAQHEKQCRLAIEYGVSESMISLIVNGKRRLPTNGNSAKEARAIRDAAPQSQEGHR